MNTIKDLRSAAISIVDSFCTEISAQRCKVTTTVLMDCKNDELFYSLSYFIKVDGENVHGSVNAPSYEQAINKLIAQCDFHKNNIIIKREPVLKSENIAI